MPMTSEDRKIYNEKYYINNKKRIVDLLLVKVECPNCSKYITKANLERHKIGKSCIKAQLTKNSEITEMKEQIEKLSNELKELKSTGSASKNEI